MKLKYLPYFAEKNRLSLICWVQTGKRDRPVVARNKPELEHKVKRLREFYK